MRCFANTPPLPQNMLLYYTSLQAVGSAINHNFAQLQMPTLNLFGFESRTMCKGASEPCQDCVAPRCARRSVQVGQGYNFTSGVSLFTCFYETDTIADS